MFLRLRMSLLEESSALIFFIPASDRRTQRLNTTLQQNFQKSAKAGEVTMFCGGVDQWDSQEELCKRGEGRRKGEEPDVACVKLKQKTLR